MTSEDLYNKLILLLKQATQGREPNDVMKAIFRRACKEAVEANEGANLATIAKLRETTVLAVKIYIREVKTLFVNTTEDETQSIVEFEGKTYLVNRSDFGLTNLNN